MKKKNLLYGIMMITCLFLSGCVNSKKISNSTDFSNVTLSSSDEPSDTSTAKAEDAEENKVEITGDFELINAQTNLKIEPVNNEYIISEEGEYILKGKLENGIVKVDAIDQKVILDLDGVSLNSSINSCIYVNDASKVEIKANKDTYNEIIDNREEENDETEGSAAIYSNSDLEIKGKGSLYISSKSNNGIHSKDDLEIKNLTLKVDAYNNGLKGNDSLTIESGNIIVISKNSDGLKTSNSDISSKGNQRGNINILGGIIDIYAACDGIDAAYDFIIDETEGIDKPTLTIYTANYSSYSNSSIEKSSTNMYLKMTSTYTNYRYALYYYNDDINSGEFQNLEYDSVSMQGRQSYYYYKTNYNSNYKNVKLFAYDKSNIENSLDNYYAVSDGGVINSTYDTLQISSISNGIINLAWTNYQMTSQMPGPGGMQQTNSEKLDYSAKGIKSNNNIEINSGIINIKSTDDAIHANRGEALENGETGVGNVNISGGDLNISSKDDGIHSDYILTIDGGNIIINESHEGIEGNQININNGNIKLQANDDGINAGGSYLAKSILIKGGYIDVTVGSGDTDGIDSNGTYTQTGGFVIARTGAQGGGAGALDCDSTISITGGTCILAGPIEKQPSTSLKNKLFGSVSQMGGGFGGFSQSSSSYSFSSGKYQVLDSSNNELFNFDLASTYTSLYLVSDSFGSGSYSVTNGSNSYSFTL